MATAAWKPVFIQSHNLMKKIHLPVDGFYPSTSSWILSIFWLLDFFHLLVSVVMPPPLPHYLFYPKKIPLEIFHLVRFRDFPIIGFGEPPPLPRQILWQSLFQCDTDKRPMHESPISLCGNRKDIAIILLQKCGRTQLRPKSG